MTNTALYVGGQLSSNSDNSGRTGGGFRRANLFVVRIWREAAGRTTNSADGSREGWWKGRVQRAVSGEEHDFEGWTALIEVLEEMLSGKHLSGGQSPTNKVREARVGGTERDIEGREVEEQRGKRRQP